MGRLVTTAAIAGLATFGMTAATAAAAAPGAGGSGRLSVAGSVEQVAVTDASPGAALRLVDRSRRVVAAGHADGQGALLFRNVAPGDGYVVTGPGARAPSETVRVRRADEIPPTSFYTGQRLGPGYGYLTTRDGTKLAVNVQLPGPPDKGPYPTVVEYSGYDPANPNDVQPASRLAQQLGFATVGVNMRGTGCSGGAWDYFEPLQSLDGYDAVEVVAAQPWVANGQVGMVGISYPGITQLFVAATRPPHLAAITPLSVIDDTYHGVLYPGGILNAGFAVSWAQDRQHDARPAGQGWAKRRIAAGDTVCAANQALRLQTPDVLAQIRANRLYSPARLDHLSPDLLAGRITAPTFLVGQLEDDQTGGHWPELVSHFPASTPLKVTIENGLHVDSFGPSVITRWAEFLDFYVARRVPRIPAATRAAAPLGYQAVFGVPLTLPPDRFVGQTDFAAALAQYGKEPKVRVLFDSGAGTPTGAPIPGFEASFPTWPPPNVTPTTWYLRAGARLDRAAPPAGDRGSDRYQYDPTSVAPTDSPGADANLYAATVHFNWKPPRPGTARTYTTDPLPQNLVVTGPGSVDLWLRSSAPDTDLEVMVSEVRPDGQETYVQSGWLRASHRGTLDPRTSTVLEPRYTDEAAGIRFMPHGQYALLRVPLFPIAHAFRAGSRLRITVQAPGGNLPLWSFRALPAGASDHNDLARSATMASRLVLPVLPGAPVPTPLPPCPSLRGEPCRPATPSESP